MIGATVVVFLSRGQSAAAIILLSCAVFSAAYIGASALRTVLPLVGPPPDDASEVLGDRARAALEREKTLVLRSIKELEFDRGMGKVSDKDFEEMSARLRARAARLMRQLDAGSIYREQIEKEVERRLTLNPKTQIPKPRTQGAACAACAAVNDADARFCKQCGARLEASS